MRGEAKSSNKTTIESKQRSLAAINYSDCIAASHQLSNRLKFAGTGAGSSDIFDVNTPTVEDMKSVLSAIGDEEVTAIENASSDYVTKLFCWRAKRLSGSLSA